MWGHKFEFHPVHPDMFRRVDAKLEAFMLIIIILIPVPHEGAFKHFLQEMEQHSLVLLDVCLLSKPLSRSFHH